VTDLISDALQQRTKPVHLLADTRIEFAQPDVALRDTLGRDFNPQFRIPTIGCIT